MKLTEVNSCSFSYWFETFSNITIPSIIIPLSTEALNYFQDNGTIVIPCDKAPLQENKNDNLSSFTENIKKAIKKLGGSIFPKLNWSSPKDAAWISFNKSLQCFNPADVYLLLKSSDFITHDLTSPFSDCEDSDSANEVKYDLVLRKWAEINPSDEFRCFVRNKLLVGISQRDPSQCYSSIKIEEKSIVNDIENFWLENICNKFTLDSYVFDIHRPMEHKIILIDFNPFGPSTDSLLFSWQELHNPEIKNSHKVNLEKTDKLSLKKLTPEFRFICDNTGIQPNPYMQYGIPSDILSLSANPEPGALAELLRLKIQSENGEVSSDEESPGEV